MESASSTQIPIADLGPAGMPGHLFLVDMYKGETRSDEERLRDQAEREFGVKALFGKGEEGQAGINLSLDPERGSSYLLAHPEAATTIIGGPLGEISLFHNSRRALAAAHYRCLATSAPAARSKFMEAITPFIDHISYVANVPIYVRLIECTDEKNKIRSYNYVNPHPTVLINPHEGIINNAMLPVYALYREAKNASSPFYRFLCYYKVLEGIYNHLRPIIFKAAKRRGAEIGTEREMFPDNDELSKSHPQQQGQSIKEVFDNRFTPLFRNEVAHYFLDSGGILNVSHSAAADKFSSELLAIESCARVVIATQERYVSQVAQSGA